MFARSRFCRSTSRYPAATLRPASRESPDSLPSGLVGPRARNVVSYFIVVKFRTNHGWLRKGQGCLPERPIPGGRFVVRSSGIRIAWKNRRVALYSEGQYPLAEICGCRECSQAIPGKESGVGEWLLFGWICLEPGEPARRVAGDLHESRQNHASYGRRPENCGARLRTAERQLRGNSLAGALRRDGSGK